MLLERADQHGHCCTLKRERLRVGARLNYQNGAFPQASKKPLSGGGRGNEGQGLGSIRAVAPRGTGRKWHPSSLAGTLSDGESLHEAAATGHHDFF